MNRTLITVEPWTGPLTWPKGLEPLPFQENAAFFALARNRAYLGLDPGLGKTIVAALIINALKTPTVVVCPPFLARNIEAEFQKWCAGVLDPSGIARFPCEKIPYVMIVPDSIIGRDTTQAAIREMVERAHAPATLIVDEAHRFKTENAVRTEALFDGVAPLFDRVYFLSGTPMPNRPMELYPVLSRFAPTAIGYMNKFDYGRYYCAGYQDQWGWNFSGASNLKELATNVHGTFMLRVKKDEVSKELPPKTEELVFVDDKLPAAAARLDREMLKMFSPEDLMGYLAPNGHIATYRKELGIAKAPEAVSFIRGLLEDTDESVLVFAIHKAVVKALHDGLEKYKPLVITGETPMDIRHAHVQTFQCDPGRRLFIGNIQAAGTGLTLTKATRVVFAEFSWVPAENEQASDRAHRIGQRDHVFVQYLVYKNSVDRAVLETILTKRKITAHV
jgi:SWI/SNF-related matrix-associated actin-dependent regulator 1 of chromatin subfamily A